MLLWYYGRWCGFDGLARAVGPLEMIPHIVVALAIEEVKGVVRRAVRWWIRSIQRVCEGRVGV